VDDVAALHGLSERPLLEQVCLEEMQFSGISVLQRQEWLTFLLVLEIAYSGMDAIATLEKQLDDIDADEACASGDESGRHRDRW